jgi:hypothetical protein
MGTIGDLWRIFLLNKKERRKERTNTTAHDSSSSMKLLDQDPAKDPSFRGEEVSDFRFQLSHEEAHNSSKNQVSS